MVNSVSPQSVKSWLSDGAEIAFLDVREQGQFGEAHPFFALPVPYSTFERRVAQVAPNPAVRMVLTDAGDGVAERAARRAQNMGYTSVMVMEGGAPAWAAAGYTLYAGVNVPSKTFGELLELARHTPRMTAEEVHRLQQSGADHVIVDGRPFSEYHRFSIPGGICCPNGELALRIRDLVPASDTPIIVNCAGRTRSILGAQTLIDAGISNPVYALENGTQGWFLAGLELDRGADRSYSATRSDLELSERQAQARRRAERAGASFISREQAAAQLADQARTTYLIDVRTAEEFEHDGLPGSIHAPGGQVVQATDHWIGVRNAQIILLDSDGVRAPMVANWLSQLGHAAAVLDGGIDAAQGLSMVQRLSASAGDGLGEISAGELDTNKVQMVDLRAGMAYRDAHIDGAVWSIRPRLTSLALDTSRPVVLIGDDAVANLAAVDLAESGCANIRRLGGTPDEWAASGQTIVASPDVPADADCIDFLFFTSERHNGNEAASRQYLEWEIGLVDQLDQQERDAFKIVAD